MYSNHDYSNDYLQHYGVIGMRWGRRRALKYQVKGINARRSAAKLDAKASVAAAKGNTKKAAKYTQSAEQSRAEAKSYTDKGKAIQQKHIERAGGQKAYDYSGRQSSGKTVVKSLLIGTYGTLRYNEARAKGASRGEAAVAGILSNAANKATGGVVSIVEPRLRQKRYQNAARGAVNNVKGFVKG